MAPPGDGRRRSPTLVFVALLSFVGILAPTVYHQQHMHHPVVRRQRNERVVLPRSDIHRGHDDDAVDDGHHPRAQHRHRQGGFGDAQLDAFDGQNVDHRRGGHRARAGDVVTLDSRHDHDDQFVDDEGGGGGEEGGGGECDLTHGFPAASGGGKAACESCLVLWHGPRCDSGDVFSMPKKDDPKRSRRLPAQFAGDVLMNKRQLVAGIGRRRKATPPPHRPTAPSPECDAFRAILSRVSSHPSRLSLTSPLLLFF